MIDVLIPNAAKLASELNVARSKLQAALRGEMQKVVFDLSAHVKADKLSGQVLKVQTGRLRRSVNAKVLDTPSGIVGTVGTNVEYAGYHEFGFKGAINVKAHIRKNGKAVKAHIRNANYPGRSFLRTALADKQSDIDRRIAAVVGRAVVSANVGGV